MGHVPHDPLHRIINVHWNTKVYNWTFQFLQKSVSGFITPSDPAFFSAGATPTSYRYAFVSVETSSITPPPMPDPPSLNSATWQLEAMPGFASSGVPGDAELGSAAPGYNGPFIVDVSGGAYFVTIGTVYTNASPPFDTIDGRSATLDWSGLSVTRSESPGVVWKPHSFVSGPSINGSTSAGSGTMILAGNTYVSTSAPVS